MILAWHNEPTLKAAVLARIREHQRLDQIVQQVYWKDGKGCNLGCITHTSDKPHVAMERMFGIERRVGYLLEAVFEGLQKKLAVQWVLDSAEAIPVCADLSKCHHHLAVWLLSGELLTIDDINRAAIEQVRRLHRRAITETVAAQEWDAAESAAWAAESATKSAVWDGASAAAWAAARSAAESAESARSAGSAAESAAWAARSAGSAWQKIAARSLEIFRAAPVCPSPEPIQACVRAELCTKNIWCEPNSVRGVLALEGKGEE